jgi:hypothetical protein
MSDFEAAHADYLQEMLEPERAPRRTEGYPIGCRLGAIAAMDYCSGDSVDATTNEQWYGAASNIVRELEKALSEEERIAQTVGIQEAVYEVFTREKPF